MPYSLDDKLVIAVASSALFDLTRSDGVYRERGVDKYRKFQREHEKDVLNPGVAFSLIKRLLALNGGGDSDRLVEVILLSRNDPDTEVEIRKINSPVGKAVFGPAAPNGVRPRLTSAFVVEALDRGKATFKWDETFQRNKDYGAELYEEACLESNAPTLELMLTRPGR